MTTTKLSDVAKHAGVSTATVDRIMHGRGNPKATTIAKVKKAIDDLGYRPNLAAVHLATKSDLRIGLMIPAGRIQFLDQLEALANAAKPALNSNRVQLDIKKAPSEDPIAFATAFSEFSEGKQGCVILGPQDPAVTEAIDHAVANGLRVVSLVSDQIGSMRSFFSGPDNAKIGATAAEILLAACPPEELSDVLIIKPKLIQNDHEARVSGFWQTVRLDGVSAARLHVISVDGGNAPFVADLSPTKTFSCAYLTGGETGAQVNALEAAGLDCKMIIATDLTPESRGLLINNRIQFIVSCNMKHILSTAFSGLLHALRDPLWQATDIFALIEIYNRANLPLSSAQPETLQLQLGY